ncbi:MAG: NAD(P)-dependent alcohol dehydrogenase [Rhodothermales bacterium]|nr:NAD(P)-dependent alcohol dehydrogenase [Rhodothermales bacterium]
MKAAVYDRYGPPDVVYVDDVEIPVPEDEQILIRVHATTVNSADWRARSLELPPGFGPIGRLVFGVFKPRHRILGTEISGVVESVGNTVSKFKPGDRVFADCGTGFGGHAEYRVIDENGPLAKIPENVSFEEAAALCFGGTVALDFLQLHGKIQPGDRVLINGASGTTGTALVQLAKHFGGHVTGVCSSSNIELVKSIGADEVIDYTVDDFTMNGRVYDIIVDTAGTAPWSRSKNSLAETGRLLIVLGSFSDILLSRFRSQRDGKKVIDAVAGSSPERCQVLADLAEARKFTPVIDRTYSLDEIVEAHSYVDSGRKKGSVVIKIVPD